MRAGFSKSLVLSLVTAASLGLMAAGPVGPDPAPEPVVVVDEPHLMVCPRGAMLMLFTEPVLVRLNGVAVPFQQGEGPASWHYHIPMNQPLGVTDVHYEFADGTTTDWAIHVVLPDGEVA